MPQKYLSSPKIDHRGKRGTNLPNKLIAAIGILLIWVIILIPLPVFATTADPDSSPTITQIHVNRYLIESGDMVITGLYNIPYATEPTLHADQTFIIRLMDTAGTTEIGSVVPFAYSGYHNGYREGAFSLYFPASAGLVWGSAYIIQISENPAQFATPLKWNTTIKSGDYTSFITLTDNWADLAHQVFIIGQTLETAFNKTLFSIVGTREVLTADGEVYFRGAINGLQSMAPALFVIQQGTADLTARTWTTASFDAYLTRFNGTWVGDAMTATGNQFGMSGNMAMGLLLIAPLCLGMLVFSGMKFRTTDPGLVGASVILEMGAVMGWVPAAIFATIFQLMGMYIAYLFFFSRG